MDRVAPTLDTTCRPQATHSHHHDGLDRLIQQQKTEKRASAGRLIFRVESSSHVWIAVNPIRAKSLLNDLTARSVGGWVPTSLVNHGKSAAVFRATHADGRTGALKVFDPRLVEEYGRDPQLERIARELTLRGHLHPYLIQILDGGECADTDHLFLVTELLEGWSNLADCLEAVPTSSVPVLLEQVASAAKFLCDSKLVHRDIKPANIVVNPGFEKAVLLDLGVMRPLDADKMTGEDEFVGTLQYAPPEFLFGEEENTAEGARALTFYQLGAVLHDLLVREPLFAEHKRYPKMVQAVRNITPTIPPECDTQLAKLARNCLLKSPEQRLQLVTWANFTADAQIARRSIESIKTRLRSRIDQGSLTNTSAESTVASQFTQLRKAVREQVQTSCVSDTVVPPFTVAAESDVESFNLNIRISQSTTHKLDRTLYMSFVVSMGSKDELDTVMIRAGVAFSKTSIPLALEKAAASFAAATPAEIAEWIMNYLYTALDKAYDHQDSGVEVDILEIASGDQQ